MHGLQSQPSTMTAQQEKCERFMSLVAENFKTQRDIGFYADKICVTSKYLSTLLKQETGLPVLVAEDPLLAVAKGTGVMLQELDVLARHE